MSLSDRYAHEPTSEAAAQDERSTLIDEIKAIDVQLMDMNRTQTDGTRLENDDYWEWRRTAVNAKSIKERRVRFLRLWLAAWVEKKREGRGDRYENETRRCFAAAALSGLIACGLDRSPLPNQIDEAFAIADLAATQWMKRGEDVAEPQVPDVDL